MKAKLTNKQKWDLKRRGLAGESTIRLAREFGVNVSTVCFHVSNARIDRAISKRRFYP